ncbi:MAG: GntR family transcriptional regulator [bacterium]|nr:GntR family transcriptional regulator [bacterium]
MTDHLELNMDEYLPLRDVVFHTLREAILRGDLLPGERLMEIQLASRLGVSRTPIREAIHMLEKEGLAIIIPRRGALVAGMTEKDMRDVLEIREALEELSVQVACDKITPEQIALLKENMIKFEESLKSEDLRTMAKADEEFHDVIYQATDNPKLVNMLNNLREPMYRYRAEYLKKPENHEQLLAEHEAIYEGICKKDKPAVTEVIRKHIDNQVAAVLHMIRQQDK